MRHNNMQWKKLLLLGAPLIIAAICARPAYGKDIVPNDIKALADRQYREAVAYHQGKGIKADHLKAISLFKSAANLNHVEAEFSLGVLYENGHTVKQYTYIHKDVHEAIKWYERAANQGHSKAQFNLGLILFEGYGVNSDPKKALYWFQKAADQGNARAQYRLGHAYFEGIGVPKDEIAALEWFNKAASQGNLDAKIAVSLIKETKPSQ